MGPTEGRCHGEEGPSGGKHLARQACGQTLSRSKTGAAVDLGLVACLPWGIGERLRGPAPQSVGSCSQSALHSLSHRWQALAKPHSFWPSPHKPSLSPGSGRPALVGFDLPGNKQMSLA